MSEASKYKPNEQLRIPGKDAPENDWIQLRNTLTLRYNQQVHRLNPVAMPPGDYDSPTPSTPSETDEQSRQSEPSPPLKLKLNRKRKRIVNVNIQSTRNLQDLIDLIDSYPEDPTVKYDIDLSKLHRISKPIRELNAMIGLDKLKESIVDQILYFSQDLHKSPGGSETMDYMHTVLYGPPGTGKTEVAMIMGRIYCGLGILKRGNFSKVTRSDLIAGYLGQTAIKTKKVITNALDGVLFIDEAYSLGNAEKRDSFAQECIDTLCEAASAYKDRIVIIIAGYEKELRDRFFAWNAGLESRFPWRHETTEYTPKELSQIFRKMVHESRWSCAIQSEELSHWFDKNKDNFAYFGRDIETLFSKIKICHAHRVFGKRGQAKRWVTLTDLDSGMTSFLSNRQKDDDRNKLSRELQSTLYT